MTRFGYKPYDPQLVPIKQSENIWTVEGPEVGYQLAGMTIPCPTRMTVVRLTDGTLWLHSPVAHTTDLAKALAEFGPVSALIAPNSYHYLQLGTSAALHPHASVFASADVAEKTGVSNIVRLGSGIRATWREDLDLHLIELGKFSETVFFHRASGTLIVTDLMQTFEASRVRSWPTKLVLMAGGATGPNAKPSIEIRLAARQHRDVLRAGVQQMIDWKPKRIILSHGPCIQDDATGTIKKAFEWIN
jgi:Domain of unknown function (DUF4336)